MLKRFNKMYEKWYEVSFYKMLFIFLIVSCLISIGTTTYLKNFSENAEHDYILLETKIKKMITEKNFENDDLIIIKSCTFDILSDTLNLEASYKKVSIEAEITDYSSTDNSVKIIRNSSLKNISPVTMFIATFIISLGACFILIFVFDIIIYAINYLINLFSQV